MAVELYKLNLQEPYDLLKSQSDCPIYRPVGPEESYRHASLFNFLAPEKVSKIQG